MDGSLLGYLIWAAAGLMIIGIGVADLFIKKPAGFFAGVDAPKVTDLRRYNCAVGMLLIGYGIAFALMGLPLLFPGGELWIFLSIPGIMLLTIAMMVVYRQVIARRYVVKE